MLTTADVSYIATETTSIFFRVGFMNKRAIILWNNIKWKKKKILITGKTMLTLAVATDLQGSISQPFKGNLHFVDHLAPTLHPIPFILMRIRTPYTSTWTHKEKKKKVSFLSQMFHSWKQDDFQKDSRKFLIYTHVRLNDHHPVSCAAIMSRRPSFWAPCFRGNDRLLHVTLYAKFDGD